MKYDGHNIRKHITSRKSCNKSLYLCCNCNLTNSYSCVHQRCSSFHSFVIQTRCLLFTGIISSSHGFIFFLPVYSAQLFPFEIWVTRNIMQSYQKQTQSVWLVFEVKFMYRTFIHMLLKLKSYFTFLLLLHAPRFYIFLLGILSRPLCSFHWMLNTVGLLVKLATEFAVASHLIDLTLFLANFKFFVPCIFSVYEMKSRVE